MSASANRRAVRGTAFKECEFCGRSKKETNGNEFNFQYVNEQSGQWDPHVFCSKICYSAWHSMNGGR